MIAERESGRLQQEIQRLKNEYTKLKEKRNLHEVKKIQKVKALSSNNMFKLL